MLEGLRTVYYDKVKAANGAYGALRREVQRLTENDQQKNAAALAEMVLVRELDDWYVGDTLPNVRGAIGRYCDRLKAGDLHADIQRTGGLLAYAYAQQGFDDVHSHELCRTLVEAKPDFIETAHFGVVKEHVAKWDAYRESEPIADLLAAASESELIDLADVLGLDKSDRPAFRSALRQKLEAELMYAGADSIVSLFRGRGVPYEEIARDVAENRDIPLNRYEKSSPAIVERRLTLKVLEDAWDKMSVEERKPFLAAAEKEGVKGIDLNHSGKAVAFALLIAGRLSGFFAYQLSVIIANAVARAVLGHGLSLATNAALTRGLSVALGPVGWIITALTGIPAISGAAYRKTIPALLVIGALRARIRAGV